MPRTTNGNKRRRPNDRDAPPPPPPPSSLVQLLRSDKQALEYFSSLQANLDADVQKWKDRAHHYKEECKQLTRQLEEAKQPRGKATSKQNARGKRKQTGESQHEEYKSSADKVEESTKGGADNDKQDESTALALSSYDDACVTASGAPIPEEEEPITDWTIYGLLLEAYNNFRQLGVALVIEEVIESVAPEDDANNDSNGDKQAQASDNDEAEPSVKYVRRSNEDVAADLMLAFHVLTRIQLQMKDSTSYPPFSTETHVPCCNIESHPAGKGKECALQALLTMDVYCASMTDSNWDKLFPPGSADEAICVGMRDRRQLVDMLLSSLSGEISDAWAVADRSSRLINTSLHYEPLAGDAIEPFVGQYGDKSQARLSSLAERCLLAQVVLRILYQRDEHQEAASLIWRYIVSTVPSLGIEDYPRLPPVLNLCVLESLLRPYGHPAGTELLQLHPCSGDQTSPLLQRGITLAVHAAVCVWKARLVSSDDRIADISRVELASYDRLLQSQGSWLRAPNSEMSLDDVCGEARTLLQDALNHTTTKVEPSLASQLAFITMGDTKTLLETCKNAGDAFNTDTSWIPLACCAAFRQFQVRQIDALRAKQSSLVLSSMSAAPLVSRQLSSLFDGWLEADQPAPHVVDTLLKCCMLLSDAELMHKLYFWLAEGDIPQSDRSSLAAIISRSLGAPFEMKSPVVRVINLERRPDRMKTFMAQAQSERILVSRAVARLDAGDDQRNLDTNYIWGMHAFDGQGGMVEVVSRLSEAIGKSRELSAFVESQWRPNDLKAFDKEARNDEALVALSPSERACALSHIASWKGVHRSLTLRPCSQDENSSGLYLPFIISGYARGRPLLHSNEHMPPTPVCVILEDDAILVDRFTDRLSTILEELPRDFHFCSIGYSRPKTAPIAQYSTHLGIPSCIWYLTGYVLSLEGAKHLLDSLPVRGPVDSWIGLKMCANWDNVFGQAMGVGARASSATTTELPSRKDLARILKFRAFAAMVPLCSQKVDAKTNTRVGRSWRQRDTDVTYSGNL